MQFLKLCLSLDCILWSDRRKLWLGSTNCGAQFAPFIIIHCITMYTIGRNVLFLVLLSSYCWIPCFVWFMFGFYGLRLFNLIWVSVWSWILISMFLWTLIAIFFFNIGRRDVLVKNKDVFEDRPKSPSSQFSHINVHTRSCTCLLMFPHRDQRQQLRPYSCR